MKRFLLLAAVAVATLFTACHNDDISIRKDTTFRVNLATIIEPFTYEVKEGELKTPILDDVRVRLLIYNTKNVLLASYTNYADTYEAVVDYSVPLDQGEYRVVVIADQVKRSGNEITKEFWKLENEDKLHNMSLTDTDKYNPFRNALLGLKSYDLIVDNLTEQLVKIDVEPAGSLSVVYLNNYNKYSDVKNICFRSKVVGKSVLFEENGSINFPTSTGEAGRTNVLFVTEPDPKYSAEYAYIFMLPIGESNCDFYIILESEETVQLDLPVNFKKGDEWYFLLDFDNEDTGEMVYSATLVNGDSRCGNSVKIDSKNLKMESSAVKTTNEAGAYKVIDLL